jgi:hypothetical protein
LGLHRSRMHRKWLNRHHHNNADVNRRIRLSIVVTSCRRSGLGRRTYCTPPGIDLVVTLFSLFVRNLCLDVRLWWKFVDLVCFIVMDLCLVATLRWKIDTLWWKVSSLWDYVSMIVLNNWLCRLVMCEVVNVSACSSYDQWGPELRQHLGSRISCTILSGVTGTGVMPDCMARLSRATDSVCIESFGLVMPNRLAQLGHQDFNVAWLQPLLQINQSSKICKKYSMLIYNVCTIIWLRCTSYLPRSKKLWNFKYS